MKKLILCFISILFAHLAIGQDFEKNFLGKDFKNYLGVLIKFHPDEYGGTSMSHLIYKDPAQLYRPFGDKVAFPSERYSFSTVKDSLKGKTFKVIEVLSDQNSKFWIDYNHAILKVRDENSNDTLYIRYDSKYSSAFPFLTTQIQIDKDEICTEIDDFTEDPFTKEKTFSSSFSSPMILFKTIKNNVTNYYISLTTKDDYLDVDKRGVKILFTDGQVMTLNGEVSTSVSHDAKYQYSSYVRLSLANLKVLQSKKIKTFRLNIFDEIINNYDAEKFIIAAQCITNN